VKVILVHGGKYFTSGNNIKALASVLGDKEAITQYSRLSNRWKEIKMRKQTGARKMQ